MVDADDPRRDDPFLDEPGHGEPVDGSDLGDEVDVFTGDPVDALFDVEMSGEAGDDADAEASAQGLGEVAEYSVDARSGEELPPELTAPSPADPAMREPFELELLDPTDPGITREDLEGFEEDREAELPPASGAAGNPTGEAPPLEGEPDGGAEPPAEDEEEPARPAESRPDDPYAALAALIGDDDDEWDVEPTPDEPALDEATLDEATPDEPAIEVRAGDEPGADGEPEPSGSHVGGPFDGVPSAPSEAGNDDRYAWLYDETVEPPPAFAERYLAGDEPTSPETAPDPPTTDAPPPAPAAPAPVGLDLPEPEDVEPDPWASPGEPDDETRIVDLASGDRFVPDDALPDGPIPGEPDPDAGPPDEQDAGAAPPDEPSTGGLIAGDLADEPPAPDPEGAAPDAVGADVSAADPAAPGPPAPDAALPSDTPEPETSGPETPEPGEPVEDGSDDPFALAGSIFDDVEPAPHETDWESFTGEHILSSTQEYVGLAEELTRAEPPSEQMAISAGIPGLETSLVGLDDVAGEPSEAVVDTATRPDLGLRILSGFGLLALFAVSLFWSPTAAGFAVVVLVAAVGEFYAVLVANGRHPVAAFGLAGVAGCLIGTWVWGLVAVPVSLTATLVAVALFVATSAPRPAALEDTALTMLGVVWIGGLGAFALPIITAPDYRWLIAGVVAVVAALDIGQYFVGRRFGSRPLAPVLSPKKTIEGLIGGAIVALLAGVLLGFLGPFDRTSAMFLAGVAVVLGPLGDLSVSMVKRILAVKDMGTVLPGHGGILDRIDALLFVIPAAWVVLRATGQLA